MPMSSWRNAAFTLVAGLSLGACTTYGDYGYGYGVGYGGYNGYWGSYGGYGSRVSLSYGSGNYYGWNDGYYYPGSGFYVFDRYRRPYRWSNHQQRYWSDRRTHWRSHDHMMRGNWSQFRRHRH